jgi:hypothetical protein
MQAFCGRKVVRSSIADCALDYPMLLCKSLLMTLLFVLLSACGTADVVETSSPTTYSVSAQYGSINGSWDRARNEAAAKATQFCRAKGQQVALLDEQRSGVLGFTPQKSTITFACAQDTKEAQQLASKGDFALNPWIGRSVADFVIQRGPPTNSIDLGGNRRTFQWQTTSQTPAAIVPLNGGALVGVPSRQQSCLVSLVANSNKSAPTLSDWMIESWSANGAC